MTAGYNGIINRRQFDIDSLQWPTEYRYPDRTYRDHLDLDIGGTRAELHHAQGETDDHTWTWFPDPEGAVLRRPVHLGLAQRRQPPEGPALPRWSGPTPSARCWPSTTVPAGGPEVLLPGHGFPVVGTATGSIQALTDTADLLESLVEPDPGPHERRGPAGRGHPHGHPPGPPDGAPLPPARLRRARVRRPDRVAALRRAGGTATRPRSSRPPSGPWPSSWPSWPVGPAVLADRALALLPDGPGRRSADARTAGTVPDDGGAAPGRAPGRAGLAGRSRTIPASRRCGAPCSPGGPTRPRRPWPTGCSRGRRGSPDGRSGATGRRPSATVARGHPPELGVRQRRTRRL